MPFLFFPCFVGMDALFSLEGGWFILWIGCAMIIKILSDWRGEGLHYECPCVIIIKFFYDRKGEGKHYG